MKSESRRYKIKGFRDDGENIRVLLEPAAVVQSKPKKMGVSDMMNDPMGAAQNMMSQQMRQIIHDSFSISRTEYQQQKYLIGEFVTVSIQRE